MVGKDQANVGSVVGRVVTYINGIIGIGCSGVVIISKDEMIDHTISDDLGNYRFNNVKATDGAAKYTVYAFKAPYGYGLSTPFAVEPNKEVSTQVLITTKPTRIIILSDREYVNANGTDTIVITAYAYDALGNPVSDGLEIDFKVKVPYWTKNSGSLGYNALGSNKEITVPIKNGMAAINYGWVPPGSLSNTIEIEAKLHTSRTIRREAKIPVTRSIKIIGRNA